MTVALRTAVAAHAAYDAGQADEALEIADQLLVANPDDPEAHLVRGLIAVRRGDSGSCVAALRSCLSARSGEWVLERYRRDAERHGRPALTRESASKLGAFFRAALPQYGPTVPPGLRRATHDYANIVGSSYVRSFGGSSAVFPLYVGQGPYTLLLDDASAAVTRRMVVANLKRLDPARNTLLILGSDPSYHLQLIRQRGEARPEGVAKADYIAMDAVAERHKELLAEAKSVISGKVILLGITPHVDDAINVLGLYLNTRLRTACEAVAVDFLDAWDMLADRTTGRLRDDLSAKAYPGDAHFSVETTQLFVELLQRCGFLGAVVSPGRAFRWTHVFEADIDPADRTRLWCEPSIHPRNTFQSDKVAATHLEKQLADMLTGLGAQQLGQTFLMANVREALLPTLVPAHAQAGCLAFTDGEDNLKVGRMVLDFFGRLDVRLELADRVDLIASQAWDRVVLLIHPDSLEADEARCNAILDRLPATVSVIVGTPRPDRLGELHLGARKLIATNISNRHIPEVWREYSAVVAMRA